MTKAQTLARATALGAIAAGRSAQLVRRRPVRAVSVALASAVAARGAFARNAALFGPVIVSGPPGGASAALTFDDGPGPATPAVLDALAAASARATFFVLGRQALAHADLIRRIVAEGHQLASHGFDHGILVFRAARHVEDQLERTEEAVARAVGPGALTARFRAPHGFRGPATGYAAFRRGYRTVGWSSGVFDSTDPGVAVIASRTARALHPGAIVLLHDADGWNPERPRAQTATAIPEICRDARERGIPLVTLAEVEAGA
ncbi:MAG: polysaccharide deacetylase family protein [Actinobacteria bacterium]|nr:polysaccharide deacetylase family protein [Actinomycetota bacterium]